MFCSLILTADEDHFKPIIARKVLAQWGQGMLSPASAMLALGFLAYLLTVIMYYMYDMSGTLVRVTL